MTSIVKRAVKFFLHRTFGHFLKEKLDLSQLDIDFKAGVVHLTNLELNSETINSLLGDLPLELRCGWIAHAWVTMPLKNITTTLVDNCKLELEGLRLTFVPRQLKRQRLLGESRTWGTQSDYGTRSSLNTAESIAESLDHDAFPEEESSSQLPGERELNQIIDQLLLILENVRLKNLSIELEYGCPSIGEEAVLCVEIPSFEYSDITRLAKASCDTSNSPKETDPSAHAQSDWNPSALIKCIKFPSLCIALDRKSALPPSGTIDGRGDHRYKKGNIMLIISKDPQLPDSPARCPWTNSTGLHHSSDASVIFLKLKRDTSDISIPDLDVDCTLQQITAAVSAEQVLMMMDLSKALNAMAASTPSSESPQATILREPKISPGNARDATSITLPEDDLYSNQPMTIPLPLDRYHREEQATPTYDSKRTSPTPDASLSEDEDDESFFECAPEEEWFRGTDPMDAMAKPKAKIPIGEGSQGASEPCASVAPETLLRLQAVVRILGGSVNIVYGATSPSLCETLSKLNVQNQRSTDERAKGKERVTEDTANDDETDTNASNRPDRLTFELNGLVVQTWGSLLQTRIEVAADHVEVFESLATPTTHFDEHQLESRATVLSFTPDVQPLFSSLSTKSSTPSGSHSSPCPENVDAAPASGPHFKCAVVLTNKLPQVLDLPTDVFDVDVEIALLPVNLLIDLELIERLSHLISIVRGSGFATLKPTKDSILQEKLADSNELDGSGYGPITPKSTRIRASVSAGLCVVLKSNHSNGERIVVRISDQVGPRVTTHMHSDQSEMVWLVEFDQISVSTDRQEGTRYSHFHRSASEHMFFEAQMRNTQNEVVIPLEFAIRTDRWKPSFTFVEDITISETLPELASNQDNLGSFWNFFSIFEGRGHQQAIAEATDYSKVVVTLRFPSSHVDLSKSEYDLILRLLSGSKQDKPNHTKPTHDDQAEHLITNSRHSSLDFPYGEFVQKRPNALAVNIFFTQGNWVFHDDVARSSDDSVPQLKKTAPHVDEDGIPHYYELEFSKLHIFQLIQHAGTDDNFTVISGEDFTIHDTVSYENTTPVAERIPRMRKEDSVRPMFRSLIQSSKLSTEFRFTFDEVIFHHQKGFNWLLGLIKFFTPAKDGEAEAKDRSNRNQQRQQADTPPSPTESGTSGQSKLLLGLNFNTVELEYTSALLPARGVVTVDRLEIKSEELVAASKEDTFNGLLQALTIYVIDTSHNQQTLSTSSSLTASGNRSASSSSAISMSEFTAHYWQNKGYIKVATLDHLAWSIITRSEAYHKASRLPALQINIVSPQVPTFGLMACSDSLQTLLDLFGEWTASNKSTNPQVLDEKHDPPLELQWDDVSANAFAPKRVSDQSRRVRAGKNRRSRKEQEKSTVTPKSLASQLALAEDYEYDPSISNSSQSMIRNTLGSSSPKFQASERNKRNKHQKSAGVSQRATTTRSKQSAIAKEKAPTRSNPVRRPEAPSNQKREMGSDTDSSSDIDVDWSPSATMSDSWNQSESEHSASDSSEESNEGEIDQSDPSWELPRPEADNKDVVDGEEIGLERGRKYKLMVEQLSPRNLSSTARSPNAFGNSARTLDPIPSLTATNSLVPQARWLSEQLPTLDQLLIEDFERAPRNDFGFALPERYPAPVMRLFGRINVVVKLFGGHDWNAGASSSSGGPQRRSQDREKAAQGARDEDTSIEIAAKQIEFQLDELEPGSQFVRRIVVSVGEAEVYDHVPQSDVNILMCYDQDRPREPDASMFVLQMECVRPDLSQPKREEWRLRVRSLPLRLYLDQDAIEFLVHYLSGMEGSPLIPEGEPLYFQSCEVKSVHLKVDYQPKQLDYNALYGDNKTTFFAKAVPLRAAEIHLKPVRVKGRGWDELLGKRLAEAYLPYINRTQLSSVVAGIAPIRSLLNLSSGVGDLIQNPIQQWQKDGRILPGLEKGVSSALQKWLKEGLNVGTNLTAGAQYVLEAADYYLGGSGGSVTSASIYAHAPASAEEGVREAYSSISREVEAAVHRIVAVPLDEYQKRGTAGYLSALATGVPLAILRPIIGVTEGVTKTLIGVQKWVDPSLEKEIAIKFKKTSSRRYPQDHHAGQRDGEDVAPRGMDEEEGETLASYSGGMFRFGTPSYDSLSDDDSEDDSD